MDEFGVLTQSLGLKPQGKSAPMAASSTSSRAKAAPFSNFSSNSKPQNNVVNNNDNHRDWEWDGYVDHLFGVGPSPNNAPPSSHHAGSSSFGFGFDHDPVSGGPPSSFSASISSSFSGFDQGDDVFDSVPGLKSKNSEASVNHHHGDDFFGSMMTSNPPQMTDDLLGDFTQMGLQSNGINRKKSSNNNIAPAPAASSHDDLIPGFGSGSDFSGTTSPNNSKTSLHATESHVSSSMDELEIFATAKVQCAANKQPEILSDEVDVGTFIDEDMFGLKNKGSVHLEVEKERETARSARVNENDIESFFGIDAQTRISRQPGASSDSVFDTLFQSRGGPDISNFAGPSSNIKKNSSTINAIDDFSFMFGVGPPSAEFQEIDGENEERRAARWKRYQETKERMAKAVADMNQRDFQTQQEQEERHRVAETVNTEIRQWAAGKEGNLRALLSTLQFVLWPECAWQPVSLTDMITPTSVKKVYKKATLCIHPDKVQQKGANARQKYIAEKVFDLLKEAWNKFNAEELR